VTRAGVSRPAPQPGTAERGLALLGESAGQCGQASGCVVCG